MYKIVRTKFNKDTRTIDVSNVKGDIVTKLNMTYTPYHDLEMKIAVSDVLKIDVKNICILARLKTKRGYTYAIRIGESNED